MRVQITDQHFYKFIVVCSDGGGDSDGGDGNGGDGDGDLCLQRWWWRCFSVV